MKNLITTVKRLFIAVQIERLDRRYIKLSRDLDSYYQDLELNRKLTEQNRVSTMMRRNRLRSKLDSLGGI